MLKKITFADPANLETSQCILGICATFWDFCRRMLGRYAEMLINLHLLFLRKCNVVLLKANQTNIKYLNVGYFLKVYFFRLHKRK